MYLYREEECGKEEHNKHADFEGQDVVDPEAFAGGWAGMHSRLCYLEARVNEGLMPEVESIAENIVTRRSQAARDALAAENAALQESRTEIEKKHALGGRGRER